MRRQRLWFVCVFGVLALIAGASPTASAWDAKAVHWAAWDDALDADSPTALSPLAFYAYRTIAVTHPEVYLRADALFSSIIESQAGTKAAYRYQDVRDETFFRRVRSGTLKSPAFSWGHWVVAPESIGGGFTDTDRSTDGLLDWRLPSVAVLLRAASPELSTVEAAILRYTQKRSMGRDADSLFVIIDRKGMGYLADGGAIGQALRPWEGKPSSIKPLLVFNEESVFYPLFGRDDRDRSEPLSRLLSMLGESQNLKLSNNALQRVDRLRSVTALSDERLLNCAVWAASGLHDVETPSVKPHWDEFGRADSVALDWHRTWIMKALWEANHLSRNASELARFLSKGGSTENLTKLSDEYIALTGRPWVAPMSTDTSIETYGILWSYSLLQLGLDDIIRTRAGEGASQAAAMSAILDLAGVEHIGISSPRGKQSEEDWEILLAHDGRFEYTSGIWKESTDFIERYGGRTILLSGLRVGNRFTRFQLRWVTTEGDASTLSSDLNFALRMLPYASISLRYGESLTRMDAFSTALHLETVKIVDRPLCH